MCGIVGYIGKRQALDVLLTSLRLMEYRGYDSAGVAILSSDISVVKEVGVVAKLIGAIKTDFPGCIGIGHTRWATHGIPSVENAHPHLDCSDNICLVHNGIIENYESLKKRLESHGHVFVSQTDTEVVAHLIEEYYEGDLKEAFKRAVQELHGYYSIVMISKFDPDKIYVAKKNQSILIGVGDDEYIVSSDVPAIIPHTNMVNFLADGEIAVISRNGYVIFNENGKVVPNIVVSFNLMPEQLQKYGFPHFMLKEILEQPSAIRRTLSGRFNVDYGTISFDALGRIENKLNGIDNVLLVACGTAFYSALYGEYLFEEVLNIRARAVTASEFRYRSLQLNRRTLVIVVSQSGETADTLFAVKKAKECKCLTIGIVNVLGSTIARNVHSVIYNMSGPEISVASTKSFTSQIMVLAMLAIYLAKKQGMSMVTSREIIWELREIPEKISSILQKEADIKALAEKYCSAQNFAYLGRGYSYPIALEGALKLKEISYIHAEGFAAGEMKHGPIALVSENFPIFGIAPSDNVYSKTCSNLAEVKARKAKLIVVATEGNHEIESLADDVIFVPPTLPFLSPILTVIPLQLFAYYVAVILGLDVDKPRNLAKSVTVE